MPALRKRPTEIGDIAYRGATARGLAEQGLTRKELIPKLGYTAPSTWCDRQNHPEKVTVGELRAMRRLGILNDADLLKIITGKEGGN
jgi:hypothetical protein